ncbi:MAG: hypothetical protein EXS28_06925 [Pedosphaera sp.]|nr:hypothetical protein [Pedosphaera sp.]
MKSEPMEGTKVMRTSHMECRIWAGLAAMLMLISGVAGAEPAGVTAKPDGTNAVLQPAVPPAPAAQPKIYHPPQASPTVNPAPVNMAEMAVRLGGTALLILAVFLLGVRFFRRSSLFNMVKARQTNLSILESKSLGSRHSLHVVTYGKQRILIADSPAGTRFITNLDEPPVAAESLDPSGTEPGSFAQKLKTLIEGPQAESAGRSSWTQRFKTLFAGKLS